MGIPLEHSRTNSAVGSGADAENPRNPRSTLALNDSRTPIVAPQTPIPRFTDPVSVAVDNPRNPNYSPADSARRDSLRVLPLSPSDRRLLADRTSIRTVHNRRPYL